MVGIVAVGVNSSSKLSVWFDSKLIAFFCAGFSVDWFNKVKTDGEDPSFGDPWNSHSDPSTPHECHQRYM